LLQVQEQGQSVGIWAGWDLAQGGQFEEEVLLLRVGNLLVEDLQLVREIVELGPE